MKEKFCNSLVYPTTPGEFYLNKTSGLYEALVRLDNLANSVPEMPVALPTPEFAWLKKEQEKENKMYEKTLQKLTVSIPPLPVATDKTLEYIVTRLRDIRDEKADELSDKYHLNGFRPKSLKEMKEWLKKDFYRIDPHNYCKDHEDEESEGNFTGYWQDYFSWGDKSPDTKGYTKARETLYSAAQEVKDYVSIITDEAKRLKALDEFKAKTFH